MNGVCTIDHDGKTIGLKFGMPAMRMIFNKPDKPEYMDGTTYNTLTLAHVLRSGYVNHCYINFEEPKIEPETFIDLVEESDSNPELLKQIENAVRVFDESRFIQKAKKANEPEEDSEKKSPSTGTTLSEQPMENSGSAQVNTAD
jgi:hypothetical protein